MSHEMDNVYFIVRKDTKQGSDIKVADVPLHNGVQYIPRFFFDVDNPTVRNVTELVFQNRYHGVDLYSHESAGDHLHRDDTLDLNNHGCSRDHPLMFVDRNNYGEEQLEEDEFPTINSQTAEWTKSSTSAAIPTLAKSGDMVCDVCKVLSLTPQRFVPNQNKTKKTAAPDIFLGPIADLKKKTHCPLCRLILFSCGTDIPDSEDGIPLEVKINWTAGENRVPCLSPTVMKNKLFWSTEMDKLNPFPMITILADDAPTSSKTSFIRLVPDQINFNMVENWLRLCGEWHGSACDKSEMLVHQLEDPTTDIPHFRLIDVDDNCVIFPPKGCRYVALSYVWGKIDPKTILRALKSNIEQLSEPRALLLPENYDRTPVTIRDAMEVVRKLHLRYLWVDSLCIIQDDNGIGGSKLSSIEKMDLVYGGAYLTLMAETGSDANAGLPGLRPGTRGTTQSVEQIYPGLRLGFKELYGNYARHAYYNTRGWTYQELQFTRRSLIFIGGQVVFTCRGGSEWREDCVFEDKRTEAYVPNVENENDIGHFEVLISNYNGRSLTDDTDIYKAFAGMTRYFRTALKANLCHGIPDVYFDWFLLWVPASNMTRQDLHKRRAICPSWSWSGWVGASGSNTWDWYGTRNISKVRKAIPERTWIVWYHRKAHDSNECMLVWNGQNARSSTKFRVKKRFPFDCSQTIPTPRTLLGAPKYLEDTFNPSPGSGFLQFWTVSVVFKLDKATSVDNPPGARGPTELYARAGVYGRDGRELNVIFLNPEWAKDNVPKTHEFILLCEARDERAGDNVSRDAEPGWKYRIMLLKWHDDHKWAERVSLVSIEKDDLFMSFQQGPVWKEIILG